MSFRSKRTRSSADQPIESNKTSSTTGTRILPGTISSLNAKNAKLGASISGASQPPSLHAMNLSTNHGALASKLRQNNRNSHAINTPTLKENPSTIERPLPSPFRPPFSTNPPNPIPARNTRPSCSSNTHAPSFEPPPLPFVTGATSPQNIDAAMDSSATNMDAPATGMDEHATEPDESDGSDHDLSQQGNDQVKVNKTKPTRPRCLRSKSVVPSWPEHLKFDQKEEVLTIDAEGNNTVLSGPIQPRDVDNLEDGVKCIVHFNEFNQPIRKGGFVLVKYLGYLGNTEKFCPIGDKTWPQVNKIFKVDIVNRVRAKFAIPDEVVFNKAILMRVGKHWRQNKHKLKTQHFLPTQKTKEQIFNDVPPGHSRDNWINLVEYWYSPKSKNLSECGKEARASKTHMHTTGCTSYANKRADFVESKGKQPSHLEFFQLTHTKVGGGFVENTLSSQLLEEANAEVEERVRDSSPTKSRTEIENDVFDKLMYEEENPKRPVGFGFGVKQSSIFGVHGILRKEGYGFPSVINNSTEVESMKAKMAIMQKENQELRAKVDKSNSRLDQSSQILLQALNAIRTGKVTDELFEAAQLALRTSTSQVASASSGDTTRNGLDNLQTSNSPS